MRVGKEMLQETFGLLLLVGLLFAGVLIYKRSMDVTAGFSEKQEEQSKGIEEYPVVKFDGYEINGSQAIYYIKDVVGSYEIPVLVKTSKTPAGFLVSDSSCYADFRDMNSSYYINPLVQYAVQVNRDENDVIVLVEITYVTP